MKKEKGFTLFELVLTLVLVAVLAAMIVPVLGPGLYGSSEPLAMLEDGLALNQVMANIVAEYENPDTGVSRDETYLFGAGSSSLKNQIGAIGSDQDNDFGQYAVVDNSQLKIDVSDPHDSLQVTISNSRGQSLTHLFTVREN
ncbi:MAG: prepilin-type N-terminal cleavage/methylation domain-containing protein [Pseudomonadota bacterium]